MHSKRDDIEIMTNDEADEVIKELFDSLKSRYQNNLESINGNEFLFSKCQKVNLNHGGLYMDSPNWIQNKQATINPINKKNAFNTL